MSRWRCGWERRPPALSRAWVPLVGALTWALLPLAITAQPDPTDTGPRLTDTGPWLVDISDAAGIVFRHDKGATGQRYLPETMGAGGCVLDVDDDGWMDLYLVQSGPLPGASSPSAPSSVSNGVSSGPPPTTATAGNQIFRNQRDGTFRNVTSKVGGDDRGYGQGAVCADFDGDGDSDIYVTNFGPNVLLRNDGGKLRDITATAGVGDAAWSTSATFFDGDGDGDLDLYVVNYLDFTVAGHRPCLHGTSGTPIYCHPDVYPAAADTYYRNRGDGTFEVQTREAGLVDRDGKGLGVVALDFDHDGRQDLYVTNDSTPNFLYHNLGQGRFAEEGLFLGVAFNGDGKTEAGMGVDAADVNGDGFSDLAITNLSLESNALYLGGPTGFTYATRKAGIHGPSFPVLGFGTHLVDLDADGHRDWLVINGDVLDNIELINDSLTWRQPGQVFLGDGHGAFTLLSAQRTGDLATPRVGRGSATLDVDNDGRLDLLVSYNDDRARLYRNRAPSRHWIGGRLIGLGANPDALGAIVTLRPTSADGPATQSAEIRAGSSYLTSSDRRVFFGLGNQNQPVRLEVRWPDGSHQVFDDLPLDHYHVLRQIHPSQPATSPGESP